MRGPCSGARVRGSAVCNRRTPAQAPPGPKAPGAVPTRGRVSVEGSLQPALAHVARDGGFACFATWHGRRAPGHQVEDGNGKDQGRLQRDPPVHGAPGCRAGRCLPGANSRRRPVSDGRVLPFPTEPGVQKVQVGLGECRRAGRLPGAFPCPGDPAPVRGAATGGPGGSRRVGKAVRPGMAPGARALQLARGGWTCFRCICPVPRGSRANAGPGPARDPRPIFPGEREAGPASPEAGPARSVATRRRIRPGPSCRS